MTLYLSQPVAARHNPKQLNKRNKPRKPKELNKLKRPKQLKEL